MITVNDAIVEKVIKFTFLIPGSSSDITRKITLTSAFSILKEKLWLSWVWFIYLAAYQMFVGYLILKFDSFVNVWL